MRTFRRIIPWMIAWGFLLGLHGDRVALWEDGCDRPEQVYDIRAGSLPPADRLILGRGLRLESRQELWQVLENYLD